MIREKGKKAKYYRPTTYALRFGTLRSVVLI